MFKQTMMHSALVAAFALPTVTCFSEEARMTTENYATSMANFSDENRCSVVRTTIKGECVKTGTYDAVLAKEQGCAPCDQHKLAKMEPPMYEPEPDPEPKVIFSPFSMQAEVLFDFDHPKHVEHCKIKKGGELALNQLTHDIDKQLGDHHHGAVEVWIRAFTDYRGSDSYNIALSERRADCVKAYFEPRLRERLRLRPDAVRILTEGSGKAKPGTDCSAYRAGSKKEIACLAPDRRVDIHVKGEKETRED